MYNLAQGPQGFTGLREFVADKLNRHRGMKITRDEVLITTGSGQGIDIVSRMFVNPGDTVILEEFCYAGAINRFKRVGAEHHRHSAGRGRDAHGRAGIDAGGAEAEGRDAEIHLHDSDHPESVRQHPAAGTSPADA